MKGSGRRGERAAGNVAGNVAGGGKRPREEQVEASQPKQQRPGKQGKQVKRWTEEEEGTLRSLVEELGERQWGQITAHMEGRTETSIKQHWADMKKKTASKGEGPRQSIGAPRQQLAPTADGAPAQKTQTTEHLSKKRKPAAAPAASNCVPPHRASSHGASSARPHELGVDGQVVVATSTAIALVPAPVTPPPGKLAAGGGAGPMLGLGMGEELEEMLGDISMEAVRRMLTALRLEAYADAFEDAGFDDLAYIASLDAHKVEEIAEMVKMKPGHRQKFISLLPNYLATLVGLA